MGGGLPCIVGRLDFGYQLGYEGLPRGQEAVCKRTPSEYLRTNLYLTGSAEWWETQPFRMGVDSPSPDYFHYT